ncbi:MAG: hypothetical protein ABIN97_08700 [Ginsengibacter sp.]
MHETQARNVLVHLRKKWMYKALLSQFFMAFSFTVIVFVLLNKLFAIPFYWSLPFLILLFLLTTIINRDWKLSEGDVSGFLNITNPALEESTQLVLKPHSSLNLLQRMQLKKVEAELISLKPPDPFKRQFTISLIVLTIALLLSIALFKILFNTNFQNTTSIIKRTSPINTVHEILLPQIKNASIFITPPSYTRKGSRQQSRFNLLAEEGALVSWQIQTNIPAKEVSLLFNDNNILQLSGNAGSFEWKTQKLIKAPGFYQVKIDNKLSELYRIETIKDQPPVIAIQSPKPATSLNYGEPEKIIVKATLTDDYGIKAANILATISRGQGEAVNFTEQRLFFSNFIAGNRGYDLQRLIDCKTLGMQPGDELYFYVSAIDSHNQQTRSDVYIVTLQDTTGLTSMDALISPLDIKPELFRSQRQIIIETEQLLKDKATISAEEFKKKSNDLGIDQKLLRMRYGKFLGEETDTKIGDDHDDHEEIHNNKNNTDNTNEILEKYGHNHDNAEDATFFDPETKKQLKATLAEMWNAELKLRTFFPKEALPYEYKALRLLKDLQQKSRVYVQKTGFKPTTLNPDKRLSGDLFKISQAVMHQNLKKPDTVTTIVRRALGALEQLKAGGNLTASSQYMLQQAFGQLSISAANQPAVYLTSLSAVRKILNGNYKIKDIDDAEHGLQHMTAVAEKLPYSNNNAGMNLSKQYFMNLNKGSRQ